jgi:DNA-3-methyladenine glycosylase II
LYFDAILRLPEILMPITSHQIKVARLHLQNSDATMNFIVRSVGPCTIRTKSDRFMTLVSSILSQQISGAAAKTIQSRLAAELSPQKISPKALAPISVDQLRNCGISRQKAGYILDLATKVDRREVNLQRIARLDDEEVIHELTKVRGIGRWTAQMFLMFCLGRLDVFPSGDLGIQNAVKKHYKSRGIFDLKRMEKLAQPWRPYATIASWYLWRSLDIDVS